MSQPQQPPPQGPNQPPMQPGQQRPPMQQPPPQMYVPMTPMKPRRVISSEVEKAERQRTLIYSLVFIIGVLVLGFIAGVVDQAIHSNSGVDRNRNFFIVNSEDLLLIVASMAPWAVLFFLLCIGWVTVANRLFVKWNSALADDENDEAYGKGIIYEIVRDNNAAAALVLVLPMLVIAVALIFIVLLIK